MKLFAVRRISNQEPVGFFSTERLETLRFLVDSVISPQMCEYKQITEPWAICWEGNPQGWRMGEKSLFPDLVDSAEIAKGISFNCEEATGLSDFLGYEEISSWKPLDPDNQTGTDLLADEGGRQ